MPVTAGTWGAALFPFLDFLSAQSSFVWWLSGPSLVGAKRTECQRVNQQSTRHVPFRLSTPGFRLGQLPAVWLWGKSPTLSEPAAVMCGMMCYEVWKHGTWFSSQG